MTLVEIGNVRYRYPTGEMWVLDGLSLTIEAGEYIVVAGASGSGKSTLLRLLNGLIPHFYEGTLEGRVRVAGRYTDERPVYEWLPYVGLVFQNPKAQLFASSVERELAFGLESLGLERATIRERIAWTAEVTGIRHLLGRAPHSLSGGEQQRVAIASVLALRPRLLALDEPFVYLDPQGVSDLREILRRVRRDGLAVVVAEHRLSEALIDADRVVVLNQGRVAIDDPPRNALRHDLTPFHLNLPALVRLAHEQGLSQAPLTVEEAVKLGLKPASSFLFSPDGSPSPTEAAIEIEDLGFGFENQPALRGVSFRVQPGETIALVGRNGSGKTTLLKLLNGLRKPASGRAIVLGRDARRARVADLAQHIGFVFQNPNDQLFQLTVREEIAAGARALGRYDPHTVERLYDTFGLRGLLESSPFRLSEGQKKRVAFASTLAAQPEILLLDEPTVGQDAAAREALAQWLRDYHQTIVLATHDLEFAEAVAPRWLVLTAGELVADGTPAQVMANAEVMARAGLRPTPQFELWARESAERSEAAG